MFRAVQLYTFLEYCESSSLEKEVLDCGAGVGYFHEPPLMRFFEFDYKTYGIDISSERVEIARKFCEEHQIDLNIRQGDMRELPLEDESMSFVFSYNTIYHMTKHDVAIAMREIRRVLKRDGLCFVNFLSKNSETYGKGKKVGNNEFLQPEREMRMIHAYYEDDEPDGYFDGFHVLFKEKRIRKWIRSEKEYVRAYIDYIARRR